MRNGDKFADGRIKKTAFLPRASGADRDGLSVSIEDVAYRDLHRAEFEGTGKLTASISVEAIVALGLGVVPDPAPHDPRHALITGIPDRTLGDAEKLRATRFAEQLASRAKLYVFPPKN